MHLAKLVMIASVVSLVTTSAMAQDPGLTQIYGAGVHAYFAGDLYKAEQYFTAALDGGFRDPRCYYFRGLVELREGRTPEASADFIAGAKAENEHLDQFGNISKSLERIQGPMRMTLERYRAQGRKLVQKQREAQRMRRYEHDTQQMPMPGNLPFEPPSGSEQPAPATPAAPEPMPPQRDPFGDRPKATPTPTPPPPAAEPPRTPPPSEPDPFDTPATTPAPPATQPPAETPEPKAGDMPPIDDPFGDAPTTPAPPAAEPPALSPPTAEPPLAEPPAATPEPETGDTPAESDPFGDAPTTPGPAPPEPTADSPAAGDMPPGESDPLGETPESSDPATTEPAETPEPPEAEPPAAEPPIAAPETAAATPGDAEADAFAMLGNSKYTDWKLPEGGLTGGVGAGLLQLRNAKTVAETVELARKLFAEEKKTVTLVVVPQNKPTASEFKAKFGDAITVEPAAEGDTLANGEGFGRQKVEEWYVMGSIRYAVAEGKIFALAVLCGGNG